MLIGNKFNKRCEIILLTAGKVSDFTVGRKISVHKLADELNLDRVEIRNLFQYLIDLDFISVETIGGPVLYGHISLTKKGLLKIKSLRSK